jgi:hypothetical protein
MASVGANYNGRQPNNTAYIKTFVAGSNANIWTTTKYTNPKTNTTVQVIVPNSTVVTSLYIPGNLYVDGAIINPSDIYLKENISQIDTKLTNNILKLNPSTYTLKNDPTNKSHFGFIAQEFEEYFPELISVKPDKNLANIKAINYIEIIPLLVAKIQEMQKEIDILKTQINVNDTK